MISNWFVETALQWLACVLVAAPFAALAIWQRRKSGHQNAFRSLANLAAFFFAALALARSSTAFSLIPSPWQGMLLEGIFAFSVIVATHTVQSSGLTPKISKPAWRAAAIVMVLLLLYVVIRNAGLRWLNLGEVDSTPGWAYLLYLATLPGIAEELAYRGVIQSHLNEIFPRKWKLAGANLGWGFAITAMLFWGIHAFTVNAGEFTFRWQSLTMPFIVGLGLGWMRERTRSIWPGVIAHNLVNLVWILT
jgi:membrane protease YdiL (CAAX protease family)